jgi:Txe/YoeB family toxin of Txe-Axe toxin-antitoxin module
MRLEFDPQALEDLRHWVETDRRKALRIIQLIEQTLRSPFAVPASPSPSSSACPAAGRDASIASIVWSIRWRAMR